MLNKQGAGQLEEVYSQALRKLNVAEFEAAAEETGALVLDTRDAQVFNKAFIPNSVNIGVNGQFAVWVGTLITDLTQPILLVCDAGKEEECVTRLARVGYDNTIGYLDGGIDAWMAAGKQVDTITSITADEFAARYNNDMNVLDVRRPGECETGHVANAENKPLDFINDWTSDTNRSKTYYIHCAGGYRSMVAASILKARGFEDIIEVAGGYGAIAKTNVAKDNSVTAK